MKKIKCPKCKKRFIANQRIIEAQQMSCRVGGFCQLPSMQEEKTALLLLPKSAAEKIDYDFEIEMPSPLCIHIFDSQTYKIDD